MEMKEQLYRVQMLCPDCLHQFEQVTKYAGYRWHRCPKCGSHFAKKIWDFKAEPIENKAHSLNALSRMKLEAVETFGISKSNFGVIDNGKLKPSSDHR